MHHFTWLTIPLCKGFLVFFWDNIYFFGDKILNFNLKWFDQHPSLRWSGRESRPFRYFQNIWLLQFSLINSSDSWKWTAIVKGELYLIRLYPVEGRSLPIRLFRDRCWKIKRRSIKPPPQDENISVSLKNFQFDLLWKICTFEALCKDRVTSVASFVVIY